MKIRILISLLLFVAGTTAAIAQQDKPHWEIEVGMCVANFYDHANMNPFILDEINTDDDGFTTPTFALEAGYVFSNRDIAIFFSTFSNYSHRLFNGGPYPLEEREFIIHLLPGFRYYYYCDEYMRVYLNVGVGVRYRRFNEIFRGDTAGYGSFIPTFQFSPACLSIGKNLSFVMDIGLGRPYMMFAFKLAYRFL